jgi:hypothetical protein
VRTDIDMSESNCRHCTLTRLAAVRLRCVMCALCLSGRAGWSSGVYYYRVRDYSSVRWSSHLPPRHFAAGAAARNDSDAPSRPVRTAACTPQPPYVARTLETRDSTMLFEVRRDDTVFMTQPCHTTALAGADRMSGARAAADAPLLPSPLLVALSFRRSILALT